MTNDGKFQNPKLKIQNNTKIPKCQKNKIPKFQIQNNIKILMTKIGKLVLKIGILNLEFVLDFGFGIYLSVDCPTPNIFVFRSIRIS
jgi:hypothetical protein